MESIRKLNARELQLGIAGTSGSWHSQYATSPVIYIGGLRPTITDELVLGVFEQFGVVMHLNIVRDEKTNEPRGFAFLAYEDPRSAVLAVDNFNGIQLNNRMLRVDHVQNYKYPSAHDGTSSEHNVRPPHYNDAEVPQAPLVKAPLHKDEDIKREGVMMERLKEMRRMRNEAERISEEETKASKGVRKRPPIENSLLIPVVHKDVRPQHLPNFDTDKQRYSMGNEAKSERRLQKEIRKRERAAIRAERHKRRTNRKDN